MIYEYMSFYSYGALYTKLSNSNLIVKYKKIFFYQEFVYQVND